MYSRYPENGQNLSLNYLISNAFNAILKAGDTNYNKSHLCNNIANVFFISSLTLPAKKFGYMNAT
jgi:hypothetical protein